MLIELTYRRDVAWKFSSRHWVNLNSVANARRDVVVLGIRIAAIVLLIWNGSLFFHELSFAGVNGDGVKIMTTALTLNPRANAKPKKHWNRDDAYAATSSVKPATRNTPMVAMVTGQTA